MTLSRPYLQDGPLHSNLTFYRFSNILTHGTLRFLVPITQSYERIHVLIPYRLYAWVSDNKKNNF